MSCVLSCIVEFVSLAVFVKLELEAVKFTILLDNI